MRTSGKQNDCQWCSAVLCGVKPLSIRQDLRQVPQNPDDSTQEPSAIVETRDTAESGALVFYFEDPETLDGILS